MCKVAKKSDVYVDTTEQLIDSSSVGCQIYWQKPKSIIRNRDKELWKIEKDFPSDAVPSPSIATSRRFCLLFAVGAKGFTRSRSCCGSHQRLRATPFRWRSGELDPNTPCLPVTRSSWPSLRPTAGARAAAAPVVLVAACEAPRRRWCRCRCSRPGATARRSTCKMRAMRGERQKYPPTHGTASIDSTVPRGIEAVSAIGLG